MNKYEEDILEVPKEIQKEVFLAKFKIIRRDHLNRNYEQGDVLSISQILQTKRIGRWYERSNSIIDAFGIIAAFIDLELDWGSTVEGMEYWRQKFNKFVKDKRYKR